MKPSIFIIILTLNAMLLQPGIVQAQDTKNLTLTEAINLGVANSKQLKLSKAKIDEATATLKQAIENKLPEVKLSGSYLYLPIQPNISMKNQSGGGSGGGTSDIKVNQALYGIANVSVPLYSGLKIQYGIEAARDLEKATMLDADNDREDVILNIINAYANLYKANVAVSLIKENLEQSRKRDVDFANLEKNGLLARNDVLKAALQTSNIELSLVNAENNAKLANISLDLLLGLPTKTMLEPDTTSLRFSTSSIQSIDAYEQLALQNRKDVEALNYRQKAASTSVKLSRSDYYPGIALTGGYIAADVPGFLSLTNAVNVGVGVQYNLSSLWKTKSKIEQAQARVQQTAASQELLQDAIRMQINKAYEDFLSTQKKVDVEAKAVIQATENYKITKNKYDNSLVTTTDLLDANVALLQANINVAMAKTDVVVAYNTLLQTAGLLGSQMAEKK